MNITNKTQTRKLMVSTMNLGYKEILPNYGWYIDKTPQNVLDELKIQIDELQSDFSKGKKYNNDLAGEIEHEYKISPLFQTKQYIKDLSQLLENKSQFIGKNYNPLPTLRLSDFWINFQKKHEYNPIHNHKGAYSFVIWYQIPYTFENELKYHHTSQECHHGKFGFVSPSPFGESHKMRFDMEKVIGTYFLDTDKSKEGYIAIFPSNLDHIVYPFYSSNDYRITVAGNIEIKQN